MRLTLIMDGEVDEGASKKAFRLKRSATYISRLTI